MTSLACSTLHLMVVLPTGHDMRRGEINDLPLLRAVAARFGGGPESHALWRFGEMGETNRILVVHSVGRDVAAAWSRPRLYSSGTQGLRAKGFSERELFVGVLDSTHEGLGIGRYLLESIILTEEQENAALRARREPHARVLLGNPACPWAERRLKDLDFLPLHGNEDRVENYQYRKVFR